MRNTGTEQRYLLANRGLGSNGKEDFLSTKRMLDHIAENGLDI